MLFAELLVASLIASCLALLASLVAVRMLLRARLVSERAGLTPQFLAGERAWLSIEVKQRIRLCLKHRKAYFKKHHTKQQKFY